jgi:cardiolipin synthase A/B
MLSDDLIAALIAVGGFAIHVATVVRAITRPNRAPASRVAWIAVIMILPVIGVIAYLFLGETSIGRDREGRLRDAEDRLAKPSGAAAEPGDPVAASVSDLCRTINGFGPTRGNRITLLGDPDAEPSEPTRDCDAAIAELIEAFDAATDTIHLSFYIWLDDGNGGKVADAISRAAQRGVTCRVMADALGSRDFIRGPRWRQLREAGVDLKAALQDIPRLGSFALRRIDLRNHRKLVVIDNRVAFVGSQNCADPAFLIKHKYAPWIDILFRCEGPVVRQAQHLFLAAWIAETGEDGLYELPAAEPAPETFAPGVVAQMFGTGPITPGNTMSDAFVSALYAAERELIITTPYFVPDEALFRAVCATPRRGVSTTLIVPRLNDSGLVAAASRSTYPDLLACGVRLFEYRLGLLHTKSITVDGRLALVGSANMDRRSLDLNFENNLLIVDSGLTATIRERQLGYLSRSDPVEAAAVSAWPFRTRLARDAIGMASPLL